MAYSSEYDYIFKVLLIGDSGVGKSSLLVKYADGYFTEQYISTIGVDFKVKMTHIPSVDKSIKLQLWDTAGQERFRCIISSYFRAAEVVVIAYDCTNRESFDNIGKWLAEVERYAPEKAVKMLCALKTDLTQHRVVSTQEGNDLADRLQVKYVEASAKTGQGVEEVFEMCSTEGFKVRDINERSRKQPMKYNGEALRKNIQGGTAVKDRYCNCYVM